jgi:hypothetical protein
MKNAFAIIASMFILTACQQTTNNRTAENSTRFDPIDLIFGTKSTNSDPTIKNMEFSYLKVSPNTSVDAGTIQAETPWEQEFLLETLEDGVEIGETVAECNTPLKISFVQESETRFRLIVTIIPKSEHPDFKCVVKIPIFNRQKEQELNLNIIGKVKI